MSTPNQTKAAKKSQTLNAHQRQGMRFQMPSPTHLYRNDTACHPIVPGDNDGDEF
ncbi:hypothetical protein Vi05172_g6688 [Venturia inaequalis]|nr:hypothetical protein Vi05172_g6688 [Venturia inaequalis]